MRQRAAGLDRLNDVVLVPTDVAITLILVALGPITVRLIAVRLIALGVVSVLLLMPVRPEPVTAELVVRLVRRVTLHILARDRVRQDRRDLVGRLIGIGPGRDRF